ncbi:MAG TPA: ATP-binding protein [Chitinophagaceae bacterium]|jgi:signal transduction histidine kinase|nr:ATP-binding protein [Chitinophagaceae bacterium]
MRIASIPPNEQERLQELYRYRILDTDAEKDFDHLVELASLICGSEMSVLSLIDRDRQWFKARIGLSGTETSRETAFCSHTILQDEVLVVSNAQSDERFSSNPSVTGDPFIRFYAGAPIISERGFKLGTLCVFDNHERPFLPHQEEALKRLSRQAAILMELRLKNEQLQAFAAEQEQLKSKADAAARAQEQFLSTMSHEIRTPLNGILGLTNLLLLEQPQPHQAEYLNALKFAGDNLLTIVNDILDYNKIQSGSIELERVPFDLQQLLHQVQRGHKVAAGQKGITLLAEVSPGLPARVIGDPNRLTQVLNNLIGNAVKFTKEGGVTLRVTQGARAAGKIRLVLSVSDTGIGIRPDQLESIFHRFTQANAGISREYGGTGLGLAIARRLVQLMGSDIEVESIPGSGSTFRFGIDLAVAEASPAAPGNTAAVSTSFPGMRVLLVEDQRINVMVMENLLRRWEVILDHAENGAVALEKLAVQKYDLVFMDMLMPVMDGVEATRILRETHHYRGPIVVVTADAFVQQQDKWEAMGFDDFILKPFHPVSLMEKLDKYRPLHGNRN